MRFNTSNKGSTITENYEGHKAYKLSDEMALYSLVVTSTLSDKFYTSNNSEVKRLIELISKCKPEFVCKLAIYAREKMYLRSIPLVLMVELAKIAKGQMIGKTVERIIQRADELTEILGYYQIANNRKGVKKLNKLSKQIQRGIKEAFNKFDEYQFAKYNKDDTEIKIRDAMFLTHPKPKNKEQELLFKKIAENTLETPYTWEVELSKGNDKKKTWEELIESKKVGYMALIRNMRNILDANVSLDYLMKVSDYISNEKAVMNSKQLPFRFFSAYRELQDNSNVYTYIFLEALEKAVLFLAKNIKGYDYNTSVCIACDVSGSMEQSISAKSKVQLYDIGLLLGCLLQKKSKAVITGIFGDEWKVKQLPKNNVLTNVINLHSIEGEVGYSTNGYKVIKYLIDEKIKIDKIMIFTDCQLYGGNIIRLWSEYKKLYPESKLYLFDLNGHGNTPLSVNEKDVYLIAGWSDKIFDVLNGIENGGRCLDEINKIKI